MRLGIVVKTIALLICSNTFMTVAWYGHLKYRSAWLPLAILVSWLIALPEYALQVPANRIGAGQLSATQLKIIQEVISVTVFVVFAFFYFREVPTWRTGLFLVQPKAASHQEATADAPPPDSLPAMKSVESPS